MAMESRWTFVVILILFGFASECQRQDAQILSKSQIEDCSRTDLEDLNCTYKLVLEIAIPSGTKGSSNTIEVPVDKARSVSSGGMQIFKDSYKISIEKSSTNVIFRLSYEMDANFRPYEIAFSLNKCNPLNDYRMGGCSRLRDRYNNPIVGTEAICCRCGKRIYFCRKKSRSAHCLRYDRTWYRIFSVRQPTLHFYVKIIVYKEEEELSVIYLAPSIPQGVTYDKFLKASIQGDYLNYQGIQKMENFYLSAPKNLESVMRRNQLPQYVIARRFERINKAWPKPQVGLLSLGITEELMTNIFLEIKADDIRYIINVSSGNITAFYISTVEALTKPTTAIVTIRNTGDLVASYYVSVQCTKGVNPLLTGFNVTPIENMFSSKGGNSIGSFFSRVGKSFLDFGRNIVHKFGHGVAGFFNGKNCMFTRCLYIM